MLITAITTTIFYIIIINICSMLIGSLTAITAWKSGSQTATLTPLLVLALSPWLIAYLISDIFLVVNPILGTVISFTAINWIFYHYVITLNLHNYGKKIYEAISLTTNNQFKIIWISTKDILIQAIPLAFFMSSSEILADFGTMSWFGQNTLCTFIIQSFQSQLEPTMIGLSMLIQVFISVVFMYLITNNTIQNDISKFTDSNYWLAFIANIPTITILWFTLQTIISWNSIPLQILNPEILHLIGNTLTLIISVVIISSLSGIALNKFSHKTIFFYSLPMFTIAIIYWSIPFHLVTTEVAFLLILSLHFFGNYSVSVTNLKSNYSRILENLKLTKKIKEVEIIKTELYFPYFIITSAFVAIEILKELSATILFKTNSINTLAYEIYTYAQMGMLQNASNLLMILICMGIILLLLIILIKRFE